MRCYLTQDSADFWSKSLDETGFLVAQVGTRDACGAGVWSEEFPPTETESEIF